jgi:hypothetical protein
MPTSWGWSQMPEQKIIASVPEKEMRKEKIQNLKETGMPCFIPTRL